MVLPVPFFFNVTGVGAGARSQDGCAVAKRGNLHTPGGLATPGSRSPGPSLPPPLRQPLTAPTALRAFVLVLGTRDPIEYEHEYLCKGCRPYNGMFPCFLGGFLSTFVRSRLKALIKRGRVKRGSKMSSM